MGYGQQYFKNRKAVNQLSKMIDENCIDLKEAELRGIKRSMIKKWEKVGKISPIIKKGKNLYNFEILKKLFFEEIS
ncbi:hypothetical protein KJ855_02425 [Patescibacteria group bacterium]|nr:hypothetical protein [Patescibacteria group bacterium]